MFSHSCTFQHLRVVFIFPYVHRIFCWEIHYMRTNVGPQCERFLTTVCKVMTNGLVSQARLSFFDTFAFHSSPLPNPHRSYICRRCLFLPPSLTLYLPHPSFHSFHPPPSYLVSCLHPFHLSPIPTTQT